MRRSLRLLLTGSAFSPERLFRSGGQGFYFDPADPTTAYQDSAGTTAGVVAQPLGRRLDKSGRGNNATQGTSASRPVWAQDASGFYRDTFDGFDDSLTIAAGGGSTTGFFYCGAIVTGGGAVNRTILSDISGNNGHWLRVDAGGALQLIAGNGVGLVNTGGTAGQIVDGTKAVVSAWYDGVNLTTQINQGALKTAAVTMTAGTPTMTEGKDNGAASGFFNGSIYTRVYRAGPPPSAAQIAQVQRFIASRAGVTL